MRLFYTFTDQETGSTLGVYDETTTSTHVTKYVGPFASEELAEAYCRDYVLRTGWGYSPRANRAVVDGQVYAYCSRWTSCD